MNFFDSTADAVRFDFCGEVTGKNGFFEKYEKYITYDEDVIRNRQQLFAELEENKGLAVFIEKLIGCFDAYDSIVCRGKNDKSIEKSVQALVYPKLYVEIVDLICGAFGDGYEPRSFVLRQMYETAMSERAGKDYESIKDHYKKKGTQYTNLHSILIGVNLTPSFEPKEAGIVSLGTEEYKSGDILDRIFKLDFSFDEYHCIAPLTTIDRKLGFAESQRLNYSILKALASVYKSSIAWCGTKMLGLLSSSLKKYSEFAPVLRFALEGYAEIQRLREDGLPFCYPDIAKKGEFEVRALYDVSLCSHKKASEITPNSIKWEEGVGTYILTGKNSGGKSVFLRSVAYAQFAFQLGMPIPAKGAALAIADRLYMVSASRQNSGFSGGRFEDECRVMHDIAESMSDRSLLLFDEVFSSTSPNEAVAIAGRYISRICKSGARCVFVTHMRDISENEAVRSCECQVGYMHTDHKHRVLIGMDEGTSEAQSIARKYGLA